MDHAISQLRDYMNSAIDHYLGMDLTRGEVRKEVKAYVDALNSLEDYYYGEKKTNLEVVLIIFREE